MLRVTDPGHAVQLGLRITHELMAGHGAPAVRVGLHHGTAVERDGDYFGAAVNLAARVSAVATGGEVLLSAHTAALAPDLDGVIYEPRGRQTLRNMREPIELFAAVRQGRAAHGRLVIDPVCQMAVDPDHAAGRLLLDGTAYHFCTIGTPFRRGGARVLLSRPTERSRRPPVSTGAIIAIVVAVVVILAILAIAMPRARERSRIRRTSRSTATQPSRSASRRTSSTRRAEIAGAQAQQAEADAQIAEAEAQRHEAVAEADPADLRGRENEDLATGLDHEAVRPGAER